jgi:hypothetical protein
MPPLILTLRERWSMQVRVREGYVLFIGTRSYQEGTVIDATEEEVKGQHWKVEAVNGRKTKEPEEKEKSLGKETISNRMMKRPQTGRSLKEDGAER